MSIVKWFLLGQMDYQWMHGVMVLVWAAIGVVGIRSVPNEFRRTAWTIAFAGFAFSYQLEKLLH